MAKEPSNAKTYFWVAVFFGVGVAIALAVALALMEKGRHGPVSAVVFGAMAGGYGAWLIFAVALGLRHRIRRQKSGPPPPPTNT